MSKIVLVVFCSIFLLASCASVEHYNSQITKLHSVSDLHEDVDKVYQQLQRNHPHLYQFTSKDVLDFKFDSLKGAIKAPMDSRAFYKELAAVTKHIGQGHMSLAPPSKKFSKKERRALNKTKFDINNLDFEHLDDKLFVVHARGADTLLINAEVLMIEDETPQDLITAYKKTIASDGYNQTLYNRVAGNRFMRYYANDKGRFDSITLTLKNSDSTFVKMYSRVLKKDSTAVKKDSIKSDSIKSVKKSLPKLTKAEKKARKKEEKAKQKFKYSRGYDYARDEYKRNLNFVGQDSSIALLKIRGFTNGNYKDFYEDSFKMIDSLQSEALIIDLRDNFGGRLSEITDLYAYLTDKNFTMINPSEVKTRSPFLKSLMSNTSSTTVKIIGGLAAPVIAIRDLFKTYKEDDKLFYRLKQSKEREPNPLNYKGKIYVLINGNSFSASSILSTHLQGSERAFFVGEETGGSYNGTVAGMIKLYELPHSKITAKIGLIHIDAPYKTAVDGYGIMPDVEILPTYEDRLHHRDPEIEWVLKDLEQHN